MGALINLKYDILHAVRKVGLKACTKRPNWTELERVSSVQLRCTDCTKRTNWRLSSVQFI